METKLISKLITINAPKEKVWNSITDLGNATKWTSEFMPDSEVTGSFEKGQKIIFQDKSLNGIAGTIESNRPYENLKIVYNISIENGVERTDGEEFKKWEGCYDEFSLEEINDVTMLTLNSLIPEEYFDDFMPGWDKSLRKIKELSENNY